MKPVAPVTKTGGAIAISMKSENKNTIGYHQRCIGDEATSSNVDTTISDGEATSSIVEKASSNVGTTA